MKKKKKVAPEQATEWKPIVSALLAGQTDDVQKRRGRGKPNATTALPAAGRDYSGQTIRSQVLG